LSRVTVETPLSLMRPVAAIALFSLQCVMIDVSAPAAELDQRDRRADRHRAGLSMHRPEALVDVELRDVRQRPVGRRADVARLHVDADGAAADRRRAPPGSPNTKS
jgi:hypothetical protein